MVRLRFTILLFIVPLAALAEEASKTGSPVVAALLRLPGRTLGGEQFWADEFIHSGWRIQRNVFTDHYRLLDPEDFRRGVGDYDTCRALFEELQAPEEIAQEPRRIVVLLHGLGRSRASMAALGDYLAEHGGYEIVNVSYPSTRAEVSEHAKSLGKVLDNLGENVTEVNFVAHSLGNLVIRHWMHDHCGPDAEPENAPKFKIGRFVMLGPPNNGAQLAKAFKDNQLFALVTGPSGKELGADWAKLCDRLCTPKCEFGILAGANSPITNPLILGSDDLIVSVEETKLPGASDFRVLPSHHGGVRNSKVVGEITLQFLREGYFVSEQEREPIGKDL